MTLAEFLTLISQQPGKKNAINIFYFNKLEVSSVQTLNSVEGDGNSLANAVQAKGTRSKAGKVKRLPRKPKPDDSDSEQQKAA